MNYPDLRRAFNQLTEALRRVEKCHSELTDVSDPDDATTEAWTSANARAMAATRLFRLELRAVLRSFGLAS